MFVKVEFEVDSETHRILQLFADYLDLSLEAFIVDYLESEVLLREFNCIRNRKSDNDADSRKA